MKNSPGFNHFHTASYAHGNWLVYDQSNSVIKIRSTRLPNQKLLLRKIAFFLVVCLVITLVRFSSWNLYKYDFGNRPASSNFSYLLISTDVPNKWISRGNDDDENVELTRKNGTISKTVKDQSNFKMVGELSENIIEGLDREDESIHHEEDSIILKNTKDINETYSAELGGDLSRGRNNENGPESGSLIKQRRHQHKIVRADVLLVDFEKKHGDDEVQANQNLSYDKNADNVAHHISDGIDALPMSTAKQGTQHDSFGYIGSELESHGTLSSDFAGILLRKVNDLSLNLSIQDDVWIPADGKTKSSDSPKIGQNDALNPSGHEVVFKTGLKNRHDRNDSYSLKLFREHPRKSHTFNNWHSIIDHKIKKHGFVHLTAMDSRPMSPQAIKNGSVENYFTKGYWYDPATKYFLYQPSGGINNQRLLLVHALIISNVLNRTLVVPPIAPHTSMFWNYNKVRWASTIDALKIFDGTRMSMATPVLGLSNCNFIRFVQNNENKYGVRWLRVERPKQRSQDQQKWNTTYIIAKYSEAEENVIFFAQHTMWRSFNFTNDELIWMHNYVQLRSEFRTTARIVVQKLFPNKKPFLGMHIRFEDSNTQLRTDNLGPAFSFISRLQRANATAKQFPNMYVATPPQHIQSAYFNRFRKAGYNLTFSDKVFEIQEVILLLNKFAKGDIQTSLLGLLEQLVCARAAKFVGTAFSTFSQSIRITRNNKALAYDETLLPLPYKRDSIFMANCSTDQLREAFKNSSVVNITAMDELRFINEKATCDTMAISGRVC